MSKRRTIAVVGVLLAAALWWLQEEPAPVVEEAPVAKAKKKAMPTPPRFRLGKGLRTPPPPPEPTAEPEPEDPPTMFVYCPIPLDVSEVATHGTARIATHTGAIMTEVYIQSGSLSFEVPTDTLGMGEVMLPGWSAAGVYFADGECQLDPLMARAFVTGRVVATEGVEDDRIVIAGCGAFVHTDSDGSFFAEIDASPCTLTARRRDGRFTMRADPLYLEPLPNEDIDVEMVFPPYRAAGVGIALRRSRRGIVISEVQPNTPAELSGLRPRDLIIGLDGESTAGMETWDFIDIALGPSGTEVVYTVQRGEETVDVRLVRELLD